MATKKPHLKTAAAPTVEQGAAFGGYSALSGEDQAAGLRERLRQLEGTHMQLTLALMEIDEVAEGDETITPEMIEEAKKGHEKELAATEKRLRLVRRLLATYEGDDEDD